MPHFAGIDVGSLSAEAVIIDEKAETLAFSILPTRAHSTAAAEAALDQALGQLGLKRADLAYIVATGYGRVSVPFAQKRVTEISCHGLGAHHLFPDTGTVIDIGGQDSKVIRVDKAGKVTDFSMNDKCAAGTGRFLEVMADRLGVKLDDLGRLSQAAQREVEISSVCTVFAESEVVSLIAKNQPLGEIVRGLHKAIVGRVFAMVKALGVEGAVTMTGGVAKNAGVVALMEDRLGRPIHVPAEPQIVGALGAALSALRQAG
ncbi:MAG: acyl-CoA dehydratase activase [Thermodesulfobacteriota bacterium]